MVFPRASAPFFEGAGTHTRFERTILTQFSDFGLAAPLEKALASEGYVTPTPIQVQAIPLVMEGGDLLGIAQTGTGKTAAFALPLLHRLANNPRPRIPRSCRALILSPTRELAGQIAESCKTYGRHLRLSINVVFGGVSLYSQEKAMAHGVDIVVATPGRLLDLIDRRALTIKDIEVLVLDEADQMLDLGFIHALRRIVNLVPKQRQSLFFSATMPKSIAELASAFLTNPKRVEVAPVATTAERVDQHVVFVSGGRKQALLVELLKDPAITRTLVFTRTKHGADKVVKSLEKSNINAAAIHGNKNQNQRERALSDFKTGCCRVLVATDIAARGIDIDAVSHVFNYELPHVPEQYVHRIGRTARAGAAGIAISFCNGEERPLLRGIERLIRQQVTVMPMPPGFDGGREEISEEPPRKSPGRPIGGRPQGRPGAGRPGGERRFGEGRPQGGRHVDHRGGEGSSPEDRQRDERSSQERVRHSGRDHETQLRDARAPTPWSPDLHRGEGHAAKPRRPEYRPREQGAPDPRRGEQASDHRPAGERGAEQRPHAHRPRNARPHGERAGGERAAGGERVGWLDKSGTAKRPRPAR